MGVLERWLERRAAPAADIDWGRFFGLKTMTHAGVEVSEENSLALPAVWACVNVLAQTTAMLPLHTYRRLDNGGKTRATEHSLYRLLHTQPNPEQTSYEFRQMLMGHLATWGNAYAEIDATRDGRVRALWPLPVDRMTTERQGGRLRHIYRPLDGPEMVFGDHRILHLMGLSGNGVMGYSPIRQAMQAVGIGMALEEYEARFFSNGARPGLVVKHPAALSDKAYKRIKESWAEDHQGLSNAHRVKILEEGMDIQTISIPPEEAQFIESQRFQAEQVARLYRMPPHKIGIMTDATFSNIEHQSISFVVDTITPWLTNLEQRYTVDLLLAAEQGGYFVEHAVNGLLRGDIQSRYNAYAIGRNWGWLSANDILRMENMDPIDEGDIYLQPLNMAPAGAPPVVAGTAAGDAARGWLADAAGRVVRREVADVRRALPKLRRGEQDEWNAALDAAYRELVGATTEMVAGPLAALGVEERGVQDRAAGYVLRRRAQLDGCLAGDDPAGTVERLLAEWEDEDGTALLFV